MSMKPYCFPEEISAEMIRALLDKTKKKICTGPFQTSCGFSKFKWFDKDDNGQLHAVFAEDDGYREKWFAGPYNAGDILWVKEDWRVRCMGVDGGNGALVAEIEYRHGGPVKIIRGVPKYFEQCEVTGGQWLPAADMPKEAARLHLCVETISLDRLQDISSLGCIDFGIDQTQLLHGRKAIACAAYGEIPFLMHRMQELLDTVPLEEYKKLWNRSVPADLLDEYGWNANPWVWILWLEVSIQDFCEYPTD